MVIEFTERELALIENCKVYADNKPAGMPGHNLAILVSKLAKKSELQAAFIAMLTANSCDEDEDIDHETQIKGIK